MICDKLVIFAVFATERHPLPPSLSPFLSAGLDSVPDVRPDVELYSRSAICPPKPPDRGNGEHTKCPSPMSHTMIITFNEGATVLVPVFFCGYCFCLFCRGTSAAPVSTSSLPRLTLCLGSVSVCTVHVMCMWCACGVHVMCM